MLSLAKRTLGSNRDSAEDVVQEAFISAFRSLESLKERDSIKPWLRRITINAALMKLRKNKRLAEQSIDEFLPEFDQLDCRIEDRWSFLASVEDVQENQIRLDMLDKAFSSIPESYRIVLQLRDIEGIRKLNVSIFQRNFELDRVRITRNTKKVCAICVVIVERSSAVFVHQRGRINTDVPKMSLRKRIEAKSICERGH